MKTVQKSIRINPTTLQKIDEFSSSTNEGIQTATDSFLLLQKHTLEELKDIFSKDELNAIIDSFNGLIMENWYMPITKMMIWEIEDANRYEGLSERWNIDYDNLIEKIKKLTSAQTYFFMFEISRFWNLDDPAYKNETNQPDLEKFKKQFV